MAFTSGNDTNLLQTSDSAAVGAGAGNDKYILSPGSALSANQTITISDTQGTNTLQLIGGLTIASSQVDATSILLTLSNGARVVVLGANTFSFEIGGDPLAGTPGTIQTFSSFVTTSLGLASVPTGSTIGTGTPNIGVNANGTTTVTPAAGTYVLTSTAPTVTEGNTGTTTLTYTVTLNKAATEAVVVDVAVSGTATAGTDFVAPASSLTFAIGETSKTFTVTVNGDLVQESNESVILTFSGAKLAGTVTATGTITDDDAPATFALTAAADSVNEGVSNVFTVTASKAVSVDTVVTFLLKNDAPGDTAGLADFNAGAFNEVKVTILAGQTTATYAVSAVTGDGTELSEKYTVQATVAGVATPLAKQVTILDGSIGAGQSFALTKGLDNVVGTAGDDTIIGSISASAELQTLSALDIVNGGAGIDTLKISDETGTIVLPNLSGVEVVEVQGAVGVVVNTTASTGVTTLNITKAAGVIAATAGATTDVGVTLKAAGAAVGVVGGNNVTVKLSDVAGTADVVTIGTGTAPAGNVVVETTGKAYTNATVNTTLSAVNVTGGKTISVTQKAAADVAAAAADVTNTTITQGAVVATATVDTTSVTVKQDAKVTVKNAANTTGGQTETTTVKFGILKTGDVLTANGIAFTAKVDMTAAEVASAFAKLATGPIFTGVDTQGSALATKGTYTAGTFATGPNTAAGFTSAAAVGDTVVFTAARANQDATDLTFNLTNTSGTSAAPVVTTVQGKAHDATPTGGLMGVFAGQVNVAGGASASSVKTVTVDGYSVTGSGITGTTSALTTLNLSNGGNFAVVQAAETLALNLKAVGASGAPALLDLDNTATKTLNVKSDGGNVVSLDLAGATGTTALNVSGTGLLNASTASSLGNVTTIKVTETAGLNFGTTAATSVTSVDTTATTGATTISIIGNQASYAGGAGADSVTITNSNVSINKAIVLGAGNDTLTLNVLTGTVAVPTVDLKGGDGTDTIVLSAADAVALSVNGTFAGKIDGFEQLSLGKATVAGTVNLANLDDIKYVISANSDAIAGAATKEVTTIDFATSGTIVGSDTVAFDGVTTTLTAGQSASAIALAFAGKTYTNYDVTSVAGSVVTLTAKVAGVVADATAASVTIVDVDATTATGAVTKTADGDGAGTKEAFTFDTTTSGAIEDADTIVFNGTTVTLATGDTAAQIAAKLSAATYANWTTGVVGNVVTFTNKLDTVTVDPVLADFVITNVSSTTTKAAVAVAVPTQGAAAGAATVALTLDKMANGGTLELTAAGGGAIVKVTDAATGTADVLNVVTKINGAAGTVTAVDVETINLNIANGSSGTTGQGYNDAAGNEVKFTNISTTTLTLEGNANTKTVNVQGAGNLTLTLAAADTKIVTVDASTATGVLNLDMTSRNADAVTVKGGSAADILVASGGANGHADVLIGGAGNDQLSAGSNGAKLTGGLGDDLFVLQAGSKEANTYSSVLDFGAGDVLRLERTDFSIATSFAKLTATLNENTSVFSNFVDAAIQQATVGQSVWFTFKGNGYVVIDNTETGGASADLFQNGVDAVIELVGVDLNNASYNSAAATIALV